MIMDNDELNGHTDNASDASFHAMDFVFVSCSSDESDMKKISDELYNFGDDLLNSDAVVQNVLKEQNGNDDGKNTLLKLALSVSSASSAEASKARTEATSVPVSEEMITRTEITDEKSQLRKILYQPDLEEAKNEKKVENGDSQLDDDDPRRLVIAISDDEGGETKKTNSNSTAKTNKAKKHVRFSDQCDKQCTESHHNETQQNFQNRQGKMMSRTKETYCSFERS